MLLTKMSRKMNILRFCGGLLLFFVSAAVSSSENDTSPSAASPATQTSSTTPLSLLAASTTEMTSDDHLTSRMTSSSQPPLVADDMPQTRTTSDATLFTTSTTKTTLPPMTNQTTPDVLTSDSNSDPVTHVETTTIAESSTKTSSATATVTTIAIPQADAHTTYADGQTTQAQADDPSGLRSSTIGKISSTLGHNGPNTTTALDSQTTMQQQGVEQTKTTTLHTQQQFDAEKVTSTQKSTKHPLATATSKPSTSSTSSKPSNGIQTLADPEADVKEHEEDSLGQPMENITTASPPPALQNPGTSPESKDIAETVTGSVSTHPTDQNVTTVTASTTSAASKAPGNASNDAGNDTAAGNDFSELIPVPDGMNGTRDITFSMLLKEIEKKASEAKAANATNTTQVGTNCTGNQANRTGAGSNASCDVIPVKFQVSSINTGAVGPWRGDPPLLIDNHVTSSENLQNVSKMLKELRAQRHVDNVTMTVFAETVSRSTVDEIVDTETDEIKRDLFDDILQVAEHLLENIVGTEDMVVKTKAFDFTSKLMSDPHNASKILVDFGQERKDMMAMLSPQLFTSLNTSEVRLSTLSYHHMDVLARSSNSHVSSAVMSITVNDCAPQKGNTSQHKQIETDEAIIFEMKTFVDKSKKEKHRHCSFWNFTLSDWSTYGCHVVGQNNSHTSCTCNHLTNFAILVMYVETKDISLQNEQALFTLTTVGCSLSITCLLMALISYVYLKMLGNEKIMIHANLSLALLLAQIVFVSSSDAYKDPTACKVVAVLLHFLFMASFSWMMVEGIALYLCCTKGIFNHRDMRVRYFLLGWGAPLVIVVISMASRFPEYGNGPQYSCWLSVKDGLIWAFLAPMLIVVLLNMLVMGLVVRVFLTLKTNSEKTEAARLKGSLRAMMTLLPLLGVTWVLSLLVPYSVVFHYFFVIANTVQGMCIFFLHCLCNEEIRKKFYEKRRRWSTSRTISDADMTFHSRRKREEFDAVKAAAAASQLSTDYARRLP